MSHYFLCSQNKHSKNRRFFQCMVSDFVAAEFPKTPSPKPARIPPQTPPAGGKSAESILKPRALPEYLEGRTPKRKNVLSVLEKIHPRENQKSKEHFFFLGLPSEARRWRGFRRAYDLVSSHHALRAWHISDFGNRFELGTINTPRWKLQV